MSAARLFIVVLLASSPAQAGERWYGAEAGAGVPLAPLDRFGGWIAVSAATGQTLTEGPLRVAGRGSVGGYFARACWAALPLLGGDAAARLGPAQLLLGAGLQLFGFARRDDWTFFLPFGLYGGGGVAFDVRDDLRIGARAQMIWLPAPLVAKIEAPPAGEEPTLLLLSFGLTAEWRAEVPEL